MHFLLDDDYHEKLAQFYDRVEAGIGIARGCPSHLLRNIHLDRLASHTPRPPNSVRLHEVAAYWGAFVEGKKPRKPLTDLPDHMVIIGGRY
jgi:hypothetical protein